MYQWQKVTGAVITFTRGLAIITLSDTKEKAHVGGLVYLCCLSKSETNRSTSSASEMLITAVSRCIF